MENYSSDLAKTCWNVHFKNLKQFNTDYTPDLNLRQDCSQQPYQVVQQKSADAPGHIIQVL